MSKLNEFEQKVCSWLQLRADKRDLNEGAKLLLQITRNKILFENVLRKENFEKIEYILNKYIGDKAPETDNVKPENEELTNFTSHIEKISEKINKGRRADHYELPEFIQDLPGENITIYQKMRALHERLKILSSGTSTVADRLPYVEELQALDLELNSNWETYDSFDLSKYIPKASGAPLDIKQVQAARTYLSRAAAKESLSEKVLQETQNRYNDLILDGQTVTAEITEKLKALGVIVMEVKETEEEKAPAVEITEKDIAAAVINSEKEETVEGTPAIAVSEKTETDSPAGNEETPEENVINQIKTMLKNNIDKAAVISTICSLGQFGELELDTDVVENLYDKAVAQEIEEIE